MYVFVCFYAINTEYGINQRRTHYVRVWAAMSSQPGIKSGHDGSCISSLPRRRAYINPGVCPVGHRRQWMPAYAGMTRQKKAVMAGLDPAISSVGNRKPANNLMLSLTKYEVTTPVSGGRV